MDRLQLRSRALGRVLDALKHTKHARLYAVDDGVLVGLSSLVDVWSETLEQQPTRAEIVKFLESLKPFVPSLFQRRPEEPTPADLSKWKNEAGQLPPNPFSKATLNLTEQTWLREHEPALAKFLEETAETGVTYFYLRKQRDEKAAREKIRAIEYGEREHADNPFRGKNISLQNEFLRRHGDAVANFYKHEAESEVHLPWLGKQNLTEVSKIAAKAPALYEMIDKSIPLAQEWERDDIVRGEKEIAEAQARTRAAKELLGQKLKAERQARNARIDALLAKTT
jgi:hypothetical protein